MSYGQTGGKAVRGGTAASPSPTARATGTPTPTATRPPPSASPTSWPTPQPEVSGSATPQPSAGGQPTGDSGLGAGLGAGGSLLALIAVAVAVRVCCPRTARRICDNLLCHSRSPETVSLVSRAGSAATSGGTVVTPMRDAAQTGGAGAAVEGAPAADW